MLNKENSINIEKRKSKSGSSYSVYSFLCNNCGNEIKAQSQQLLKHSGKCRRCTQLGIPYKHIYNELKNHHNNKINFNLTFEDFLEIISNNKCHYCDSDIKFNKYSKEYGKNLSRAYQLDRKNNLIGYEKNNLVPCCWECNKLKSNMFTYEEFLLLSPILKQIKKNKQK